MAAVPPSSFMANSSSSAALDPKLGLLKQIRSHEVAIAELSALSSSRVIYIYMICFETKNQNLSFILFIWSINSCNLMWNNRVLSISMPCLSSVLKISILREHVFVFSSSKRWYFFPNYSYLRRRRSETRWKWPIGLTHVCVNVKFCEIGTYILKFYDFVHGKL